MKGPWVVAALAALALGCRSSQPTPNPFLRTTVPPPGTGQGAVVTPGEPYTPGAMATPIAPGTAPAVPIDPSAVPVAPPPAAAPMVTPPPTVPPVKNNKYSPPGGSYLYNQSSREPPKARSTQLAARQVADDADRDDGALADADNSGVDDGEAGAIRLEDVQLEPVRDAVRLAAHRVQAEPVELASADDPTAAIEEASHIGEPVPSHARVAKLVVPSGANSLRVVGASSDSDEPVPHDESAEAAPAATLRITAGGADSKAVRQAQWVVKEPTR